MLHDKPIFTDEDRTILNSYKAVVDGVSALIGEHCEIVLHSLEDIEHSAICIANGHNTNRQVGSPITDLALLYEICKARAYQSLILHVRKAMC